MHGSDKSLLGHLNLPNTPSLRVLRHQTLATKPLTILLPESASGKRELNEFCTVVSIQSICTTFTEINCSSLPFQFEHRLEEITTICRVDFGGLG
jgi:hypothetical protein